MPIISSLVLGKLLFGVIASMGLTVIVLTLLQYKRVIDWFRARTALKQQDKDNIAFTIKEAVKNGNHGIVQGIFNMRTNQIQAAQKYEAETLDEELEQIHRDKELVVYS